MHLHHEFSPPAMVLVVDLLQTSDHLPEGRDQMPTPARPQEALDGVEVMHWGVEDFVVVSVRNEPHAKTRRLNYLLTHIPASLSVSRNQLCHLLGEFLWIATKPGLTIIQWVSRAHPGWCNLNNNLWIQSHVLKEIVWTDYFSGANLFTRDCSVQPPGLDA